VKTDEEMGDTGALKAAIRSAKRSARPTKIGVPVKRALNPKEKNKKSGRRVTSRVGAFEKDLGQTTVKGEGMRAKKGDMIGRTGKRVGKRRGK